MQKILRIRRKSDNMFSGRLDINSWEGKTFQEFRNRFSPLLPYGAIILINNQRVGGQYIIKKGDEVAYKTELIVCDGCSLEITRKDLARILRHIGKKQYLCENCVPVYSLPENVSHTTALGA